MLKDVDYGCGIGWCSIRSSSAGESAQHRVYVVRIVADQTQKYLVPHLQPPSTTAFQSTSAEITAQYDEAAKLMTELQEQTGKLQSTLDEDR